MCPETDVNAVHLIPLPPLCFPQYQETVLLWAPDSSAFLVIEDDRPVLFQCTCPDDGSTPVISKKEPETPVQPDDKVSHLSALFSPLYGCP
jgi:hypothetical protein